MRGGGRGGGGGGSGSRTLARHQQKRQQQRQEAAGASSIFSRLGPRPSERMQTDRAAPAQDGRGGGGASGGKPGRNGPPQLTIRVRPASAETPSGRRGSRLTALGWTTRAVLGPAQIEGFGTTTPEQLVNFLRQKASRSFSYTNLEFNSSAALLTVQSVAQALAIRRINGMMFNGHKLTVTTLDRRNVNLTLDQTNRIVTALSARASGDFLDLKGLKNDPNMTGIPVDFSNRSFVAQLLKIIKQHFPQVTSLSLIGNNIRSLDALSLLGEHLPNLQNLALDENRIASVKELDHLTSLKMLNHLMVNNNPFVSTATDANALRTEIARKFPSLHMLNGKAIPKMSFVLAPMVGPVLPQVQGNFFDLEETRLVALGFLEKYFQVYDNFRSTVAQAYSPSACFSIVAVRSPPVSGQKEVSMHDYMRNSRNLLVDKDNTREFDKRLQMLRYGPSSIQQFLEGLPPTRHLLETCRVDAWQFTLSPTPMLFIFVHGDFVEPGKGNAGDIQRSFDRTFIITLSPPGSPYIVAPTSARGSLRTLIVAAPWIWWSDAHSAALAGWQVHIVNDHLVVRQHTGYFAPPPAAAPAGPAVVGSPAGVGSPASLQAAMLAQFMQATGMNEPFSRQCLDENAWNYDAAFNVYQQLKMQGAIPAAAYM